MTTNLLLIHSQTNCKKTKTDTIRSQHSYASVMFRRSLSKCLTKYRFTYLSVTEVRRIKDYKSLRRKLLHRPRTFSMFRLSSSDSSDSRESYELSLEASRDIF